MKRPEQSIHKAVADNLRRRGAPGMVFWHTPNQGRVGGHRGRIQGAILKSLGVRAGVSDFVFLRDGKFYALELKAGAGKPTEDQLKFISDVNDAGGFAAWASGLDRALACLEAWGLLKGTSTFEPVSAAAERVVAKIGKKEAA